jgi:phage-related minor tail protein
MGELDDKDLKNITTNGLALRDTFGFEMPESIRAINSLMDQFGITADEAYNLVAQGAQNGLNQNDDLLDVINEYSVQFKNSGYNADEMFNMLKNGADAGVWSVDKLGDAVKEMNIRFSDGTVVDALNENAKALGLSKKEVTALQAEYNKGGDSAQKAVGKMVDSILNVKDETKQYQLGVSVFGTMWEDLGEDAVVAERACERVSCRGNLGEIKIIASLWHGIALPVGRIGDVAASVRLPYRRIGKCLEGNKNCAHKEQY